MYCRIFGKYIQILYLIIQRDLVPFTVFLLIILFIFSGGFYFALREEVITPPTLITPQCNFSVVEAALNTFNVTVADVQNAVNTSTVPFMTSLDINPDETR